MLKHIVSTPSRRPDSEPMPLVIMIHGRGADMHDLADLAPMFDIPEGVRFVFPNAPKPFEAGPGMTFGWTWFEGWPPVHESIIESRSAMLEFIDEISGEYPTPEGKLIVGGFSQGGLMALDAGLRTKKKLAGVIALSGGLYEQELVDLTPHKGLPVFIGHGTQDQVVPVNYARRARRILEDAALDVEYHEYSMAHQVVMDEAAAVKAFIARTLGA